jgi:hypothetical protein
LIDRSGALSGKLPVIYPNRVPGIAALGGTVADVLRFAQDDSLKMAVS